MHESNVIADIAVPIQNLGVVLHFFYQIDKLRNVLIAEFEFAEKYTRQCRTRVYFQWISPPSKYM